MESFKVAYSRNMNVQHHKNSSTMQQIMELQAQRAEFNAQMQYGGDQDFKSKLQQYFLENHRWSFGIRALNFTVKVMSCILYCIQVVWNSSKMPEQVSNISFIPSEYNYLIWTNRAEPIWAAQVIVALISITLTMTIFFVTYKGSIIRLFTYSHFLLELLTGVPLIISISFVDLRYLNLPIYLNCWIADGILQDMIHDYYRSSVKYDMKVLNREIQALVSTLICLMLTGACGMEALQRGGSSKYDLFTSFYFVVVSFSTVGYGDVKPDTTLSRLYVMLLIIAGICVLPKKVEALTQTWLEKEKAGFDKTKGFSPTSKHIVVTIPTLDADFVSDFLNEFYAHKKHQGFMVVLLSPCELDVGMKNLLRIPLWSDRVLFVRGTALKDEDLARCNMVAARACFILSSRNNQDKKIADQQTILRSWAVKDYAPEVPQYVQVFRTEAKLHIDHAHMVICEDEFKFSLLANNCICPGISTFITLLMHTSQGEEGQKSSELWHRIYGFHSGNEIYDILVKDSKFFFDYVGKTFAYTSFHAHRTYGICLVGVKKGEKGSRIQLNPGHQHVVQISDRFYYIALTNEESIRDLHKLTKKHNTTAHIANLGSLAMDLPGSVNEKRKSRLSKLKKRAFTTSQDAKRHSKRTADRTSSIDAVTGAYELSSDDDIADCILCPGISCIADEVVKSYPPVNAYIGSNPTLCYTLKERKNHCCLRLDEPCEHVDYTTATSYNFRNKPIIVAADKATAGLYNLLLPLRSFYRPVHDLKPIILLLQLDNSKGGNPKPSDAFLDVISHFPDIYWMQGKISNLDNLLRAGVNNAEHFIVVKQANTELEVQLADCGTIVTVQKIHRMFPNLKITTELVSESNMRFVEFDANDPYALQQSKYEKKEKKRGSSLAFMFRLPFASGSVFSAHMLDRLLYQAFLKPYLCDFLKILLGIDQSAGSGYLASIEITEDDMWIKTYGRLFQKLCSSVADIPIGIYRTIDVSQHQNNVTIEVDEAEFEEEERDENKSLLNENNKGNVQDLVKQRMKSLQLNVTQYKETLDFRRKISYVIINPSFDLELHAGDIVYVIRSPVSESTKTKKIDPRVGLRKKVPSREFPRSGDDRNSSMDQ
ncbi:unnamed protein product [Bursaphelenchus xylophilus]|uniref:(pine wood nematode) hypothetical protein n=1 Tax=Bursaphelenchus xylophilus TaxID=6326 RepID=A0A811LYT2_BURXY|nr:unnamed protein product [Bursaphelenchus xylophilus]CAG9128011.1 unnamed protein product [Bursaphelenchus xylophilus]